MCLSFLMHFRTIFLQEKKAVSMQEFNLWTLVTSLKFDNRQNLCSRHFYIVGFLCVFFAIKTHLILW